MYPRFICQSADGAPLGVWQTISKVPPVPPWSCDKNLRPLRIQLHPICLQVAKEGLTTMFTKSEANAEWSVLVYLPLGETPESSISKFFRLLQSSILTHHSDNIKGTNFLPLSLQTSEGHRQGHLWQCKSVRKIPGEYTPLLRYVRP